MIVVDSSVWIANLRGTGIDAVRRLRDAVEDDAVVIGDLILLEVLQGAGSEATAARIERDLRQFRLVRMLDDALATKAARNYRILRARSVTIRKTIDLIIGTFCIEMNFGLLQHGRDFDGMAAHLGLRLA